MSNVIVPMTKVRETKNFGRYESDAGDTADVTMIYVRKEAFIDPSTKKVADLPDKITVTVVAR